MHTLTGISLLSSVVERFFDKEQSMGRYHEEGPILRDVAQFGRASALGAEGCRFKSCHPDTLNVACGVAV